MTNHTKTLADLLRDLGALVDGMREGEVIDVLANDGGMSSIVYRSGVQRSAYVDQLDKVVTEWARAAQLWLDVQDYDDRLHGMSAMNEDDALARTARAIGDRRAAAAQARHREVAEEANRDA